MSATTPALSVAKKGKRKEKKFRKLLLGKPCIVKYNMADKAYQEPSVQSELELSATIWSANIFYMQRPYFSTRSFASFSALPFIHLSRVHGDSGSLFDKINHSEHGSQGFVERVYTENVAVLDKWEPGTPRARKWATLPDFQSLSDRPHICGYEWQNLRALHSPLLQLKFLCHSAQQCVVLEFSARQ